MGDFNIDTQQLSKALIQYKDATNKEVPEILNRAGRNIAFRSAQYTPKATGGNIRSDLSKDPHLVYALTSMKLKKKGQGILPTPAFADSVKNFISHRIASAGFIRSGWADAIIKLGGSYRGKRVGKGHGWASKASTIRFVTVIANTVSGVDKIGKDAMQRAIDFVAVDMINHAQTVFQKEAKKHSA